MHWKSNQLLRALVFSVCSLSVPTDDLYAGVNAGGIRNNNLSSSAAGQAGAFHAQADDPSAIFYNPAGMTQLHGLQVSVGAQFLGGHVGFVNPSGATARGNLGGDISVPIVGHFYVTANLADLGMKSLRDLTVGLGVNSPYGLNSTFPDNGPFSTAVTFSTLTPLDIKPTLAYKIDDQLSVGIGADIFVFPSFVGEGQFENKSKSPGGAIPAGTPLEGNGTDTAPGFNVSVLYTPFRGYKEKPLINLGLVYRSQVTLHLDGEFLVNGAKQSDASTTLVLPQSFTGGLAVWPFRRAEDEWKLEVDIDYTGWKSVRNLDVHLSSGAVIPNPQDWRNTFQIMVGTEYRVLELKQVKGWEIALRGGYSYSETPIPNKNFNPAIPDGNKHTLSIGTGLLCKKGGRLLGLLDCGGSGHLKAIGLDLAFVAMLFEPRTVENNINPAVNGKYDVRIYDGILTMRLYF